MSLIENVLRAHRRRCEEGRRYLTELEDLARRLRADALRLRASLAAPAAAGDRLAAHPTTLRQAKVERSIAAIEAQIGEAAAALVAAEAELQRYELVVAQRDGGGELGDARPRRRGRRPRPPAPQALEPDRRG